MAIHNRIKILVDTYADGNASKFAHLAKTNYGNIRNYISGTSKPKFDVLTAIVENLDINPEWLLLGKGEMTQNVHKAKEQKEGAHVSSAADILQDRVLATKVALSLLDNPVFIEGIRGIINIDKKRLEKKNP